MINKRMVLNVNRKRDGWSWASWEESKRKESRDGVTRWQGEYTGRVEYYKLRSVPFRWLYILSPSQFNPWLTQKQNKTSLCISASTQQRWVVSYMCNSSSFFNCYTCSWVRCNQETELSSFLYWNYLNLMVLFPS